MALNFNNSTTTSPTDTANSSTEIVPVEQYDVEIEEGNSWKAEAERLKRELDEKY